ncbi:MAG: formimidoylglutamase [Brumimicrobium sp.]|nr:formimidoylglutamase [Brumimicrobium sp.]
MKDISIYFRPVTPEFKNEQHSLGKKIFVHTEDSFPEFKKKGIAIFYVPENRQSDFQNRPNDAFRNSLYDLFPGSNWKHTIYDLGTIHPGKSVEDTYHAVTAVCQELIKANIVPFIIGGTQDLTLPLYRAYEKLEQLINLTTVDNRLDLGSTEEEVRIDGWLSHILLHKPCFLFNYSNLGAQSHYISPATIDLFNDLYFDVLRLGSLNTNIKLSEPIMRNTDILSFDLNSIRCADHGDQTYASPNGFFAQESCQLMRYAGISDKITSIGIFNYVSENPSAALSELIAQMIWYFIDGYENRKGDFPVGSRRGYKKYRVTLEELNEEIVFSKSDKSSRWWMEVPYPGVKGHKFERHQMVPCSYEEYQEAMKGEIPDLWWKTYQKLC